MKNSIIAGEEKTLEQLKSEVDAIVVHNNKMKPVRDQFKLSHIIMIVGGFFLLGLFYINTGDAKEQYNSLTPAAEAVYNNWASQQCGIEKSLAKANLEDSAHGIKIDKDFNVLNQKANRDCTSTQQTF